MTMDVAELGFEIGSEQIKDGVTQLERLTAAGRRAEDAYARIERAAGMADQKSREYSQTVTRAYGMTNELTKSQLAQVRSYETMIGQQTLLNEGRKREAAQFMALRQAQTTADTDYGRVVADLAGKHYDLKQAQDRTNDSGLELANTLTRRLAMGALALAARQAATAFLEMNRALADVADTAERAKVSTDWLQGAQSVAGARGIGPADLVKGMFDFNRQIEDSRRGMSDLDVLFRMNGKSVGSLEDSFSSVADLVKRARGDSAEQFRILQEAGLPASREWLKLMEQGGAALRYEIQAALAGGVATSRQLVDEAKRFDEDWNRAWTNFGLHSRSVTAQALDVLRSLSDRATEFLMKVASGVPTNMLKAAMAGDPSIPATRMSQGDANQLYGAVGIDSETDRRTKSLAARKQDIALEQQHLSLLGPLITATEARRQVELQLDAAALNRVSIDAKRAETLKQLAYEQALGITNIKAQADAYSVEAQTVGMTTGAAEAYKAVQSVILENRRKGIELAPQELAFLQAQGELLAQQKLLLEGSKLTQDITLSDPIAKLQFEMAKLDEMLARGAISWNVYGEASRRAMANTAAGAFGLGAQLATALGTIFNKQKEGAIAAAVLNTAESITKTMAQYGATPWGLAAAAVAAAAGAAQIATIRSTYSGGGGNVSAPTYSAPAAVAAAPTVQDTSSAASDQRSVHISISGDNFSGEAIRNLIDSINEHQKDGGTKFITVEK